MTYSTHILVAMRKERTLGVHSKSRMNIVALAKALMLTRDMMNAFGERDFKLAHATSVIAQDVAC